MQCYQTCNILPRPPDRSGIIMLKLKRKLQFKGHVYFEAVRPAFIQAALTWLKENNELYKDVVIDCATISNQLTGTADDNSSPSNYNDTSLDEDTHALSLHYVLISFNL